MPSIRSLLLLGLPLVSARSIPDLERLKDEVVAQWEEVLKALPGESPKAAVEAHLRPKYREGVFEDGHDAIEAVLSDDPELASKLVDLAKSDAMVKDYLRKRQTENNATSVTTVTTTSPVIVTDSTTSALSFTTQTSVVTTSTSQAPATSTAPSSTEASSTVEASQPITAPTVSASPSTQTGVLVPVEITTTAQGGSTVVATTQAFQNTAPTSVVVQVTITNNRGETVTTSTNAPAAIVTRTNSAGSVVTTASPLTNVVVAPGGSIVASTTAERVTTTDSQGDLVILSRPTPGGVYTTTDNKGQVAVITYQPGGGTVSQIQVQTIVGENGQQSTITSFAEVGGATDAPSAGDNSPSASSTGRPSLQSGAATPSSWYAAEVAILVGAAIGMAGMVL